MPGSDAAAFLLAAVVIAAAQIIGWLLGVTLWWYLTRYAKWLR